MNLVYKTYDISTDIEYTSGTRLNLSGVRIIKLINRPSGVQVWISTDSNGTNLFPLINRGDGWELPNDYEPLYNLYVFTKGINSQDKLILSYTGEKNFFIFGNNSIEKVGEIESLGEQAQINLNNSISNMYSRLPLDNLGLVFTKSFQLDISYTNIGSANKTRFLSFPLNDSGRISELSLDDNKFYRFSIFGHIDTGEGTGDGVSGTGSLTETVHISLFNNTQGAVWTPESGQQAPNFYRLDKSPYTALDKFDIYGLKYRAQGFQLTSADTFMSGNSSINIDTILPGSMLNKYEYFAFFYSYFSWMHENWRCFPNLHCSLLFTISQAISNINNK